MPVYPFSPERKIGLVRKIDGMTVEIVISRKERNAQQFHGEKLALGEIGQFVVIDAAGVGIFGRVVSVEALERDSISLDSTEVSAKPTVARVQLLSSILGENRIARGVVQYPTVSDEAFVASSTLVSEVLASGQTESATNIDLGYLSVDAGAAVSLPLEKVFGRHAAVVGSTGSGKSWTLATLVEQVSLHNGKMILIDATGEFSTLEHGVKHVAFTSTQDEPLQTELVYFPQYRMHDSDRNAFFSPSPGVQLPKLREAVRSLRIVHAVKELEDNQQDQCQQWIVASGAEITNGGALRKEGFLLSEYGALVKRFSHEAESTIAPFDIRALPEQLKLECLWPDDRKSPPRFGAINDRDVANVSGLVSRIADILSTPEVMSALDSSTQIGQVKDITEIVDQWWNHGQEPVLRISLRSLPWSHHLREIIVNMLGRFLMERARQETFRTRPLIVAVDEAHQFFSVEVGDRDSGTKLDAFSLIAKEGRKYGLTVCLATQRPADIPADVLSQVGMMIAHRLASDADRRVIERAVSDSDSSATHLLPGLTPGEAILMGVDFPVPMSVQVKKPSRPPHSSGPNYALWQNELMGISSQPQIFHRATACWSSQNSR